MTDHTDERDRLIDSLLEEAVGGRRVPDLAPRILALAGVADQEAGGGPSGAARLFSLAKRLADLERLKNMKRTTKWASAAAVAVAIAAGFVGFFFVGPGSDNAFADARKQLQEARTATFRVASEHTVDGKITVGEVLEVSMKEPGLLRTEQKKLGMITILNAKACEMLVTLPTAEKAILGKLKPDQLAGFQGFFLDDIRKEFDCAKTPLGERVVDDKKAKGLRGTYRRDGQDYEVETWVDATTGALVCIVIANPEGRVRMVMDRFILNPELPDSLFSLEPPKGYEVERRDAP